MAMYQDVDLILFQYPEIGLGGRWRGHAEDDIREFRTDHRTGPAVGQGSPGGVQHGVGCIVVATHVGTVHHLGDLPIHTARHDAQAAPDLLAQDDKQNPPPACGCRNRSNGNHQGSRHLVDGFSSTAIASSAATRRSLASSLMR